MAFDAANTRPDLKVTDVFARHGYGLDRYSGARIATTFFTYDEAGRDQAGWARGHLSDGALHMLGDSRGAWRCNLRAVAA